MASNDKALRARLKADYPYYARKMLKLRSKEGEIKPLEFNLAQLKLHELLEEQRRKKGYVRAIILKGRQMGCSTYIQGRFYHRLTHKIGFNAFILTHETKATDNLFEITTRYHDNMIGAFRPSTKWSSRQEMKFDKLDAGYTVGTAGSKDTGRSKTIQLFHGSEVAFWQNALDHVAGVLQTVPKSADTEVIIESTANGVGGYFHELWQTASKGLGEFVAIFLPWYWQSEYQSPVYTTLALSEKEEAMKEGLGLTVEQLQWRREKIEEFGGGEEAESWFMQEYPSTPDEAFQNTGGKSLIKTEWILHARKLTLDDSVVFGPRLLGVDPAAGGGDFTGFAIRRGRRVEEAWRIDEENLMVLAGTIAAYIREKLIDFVFVDGVGLGLGVVHRLQQLGYGHMVIQVNGGSSAYNKDKYPNKRCEMWGEMSDFFSEGGVSIPDDNTLHAELVAPTYIIDFRHRTKLERKEDMKKRGIKSPDIADALSMTFAEVVDLEYSQMEEEQEEVAIQDDGRDETTGY